jgi:hypothetical protein
MAECIKCRSFNFCPWAIPPEIICSQFQPTTQTNADRIRSMTDEELAHAFAYQCAGRVCRGIHFDGPNECENCWLDWLKQEAAELESFCFGLSGTFRSDHSHRGCWGWRLEECHRREVSTDG